MSGVSKYKYHVIQFLEVPSKDIAEFVCVPRSWVHSYGASVPLVKVTYPVEEPSLTENRVINRKRKSDSWNSFVSILRYSTDNYENAKLYIQQELNNSENNQKDLYGDAKNIPDRTSKSKKKNGDHTVLSAKANEKSRISTQNATSRATIDNDRRCVSSKVEEKQHRCAQFARRSAQMNIMEALGLIPTSHINNKSTNTTTLKRNALQDPDKENRNKRFRVNELVEYDNQVAGPSRKALDCSNKLNLPPSPEDSDGDLCTQETQVEELNDNTTEVTQTINQISSKTTHILDPEIIAQLASSPMFAKWCMLMHELQDVFDNSMFKELINKLFIKDNYCSAPQNNDPIPSASNSTAVAPKFNTEKKKQKLLEEKKSDDDDDRDQPLKKKNSPKLIIKTVLPPINHTNHTEDSNLNDDDDNSITFASSNTAVGPKFYTEKNVEKLVEEKNTQDNTDQPLKKRSCPKLIIKTVPPPINYVNHTADSDFDDNDDDSITFASGNTTVDQKFNTEKKIEKLLEQKNTEDDTDQPVKKKSCPKLIIKTVLPPINYANHTEDSDFNDDDDGDDGDDGGDDDDYQPNHNSCPEQIEKVILSPVYDANQSEEIDLDLDFEDDDDDQPFRKLPREYDPNNSRWTLNYSKPNYSKFSELVELMPNSGVFVSPHNITTFKRFPKHKRTEALIRMLLGAVFYSTALMVCSLPGSRAKPIDRDGTIVRPELDRHALKVIINYVTDHVKKEGLPSVDTPSILKILRTEMKIIRKFK